MTAPNPRADSAIARRPARRRRSFSGRCQARPHLEALECRLALSTYTWIGATGGNWDTSGNWQGGQVPTSGPADIVFPNSSSAQTITLTSAEANLQVNSFTVEGNTYTLQGPSQDSGQLLNLADGATINTQNGSSLSFCPPGQNSPGFNSLALNFEGSAAKAGTGSVNINNQSNFPTSPPKLRPITIGTGTITVGNSTTMIGALIQVNSGATLLVPGGTNPSIGSLSGPQSPSNPAIVQMGAIVNSVPDPAQFLSINTLQGEADVFGGEIDGGGGEVEMNGPGSLTVGSINPNPDPTGDPTKGPGEFQLQVNSGRFLVSNLVNAQTLTVGSSFGSQSATYGGMGTMNFSGQAVFNNGTTFAVVIDGTGAGQSTQLNDTDSQDQDAVELNSNSLSVSL